MSPAELERLELLLDELISLPPPRRAERILDLKTSSDPIAPEAVRLLARHERTGAGGQGPDGMQVGGGAGLVTPPSEGRVPEGFNPLSDPLVGRTLGEYTIVRLVGVGGMGRVYEARQLAPARRVAVKVLASHAVASDPLSIRRFRREAEALGALDHPNICRILSAGTSVIGHEIVPFLAMEFLDGEAMDPQHPSLAALTTRDKLTLIIAIADGAHAAHLQGIIHRDLKPANVMLVGWHPHPHPHEPHPPEPHPTPEVPVDQSRPLIPKIVDFGVSRLLGSSAGGPSPPTLNTHPARLVGTLAYMSPERLAGQPGDAQADVFAIGVMLRELVAPADLAAVIDRATAAEPAERYLTAYDLAEDLRRVLALQPVRVKRSPLRHRLSLLFRRRGREIRFALLGLAALAALTTLAAYYANRASTAETRRDEMESARAAERYVAKLQQVEVSLQADDPSEARAVLATIAPADRGWEWKYLDRATRRLAEAHADPAVPHATGADLLKIVGGERRPADGHLLYHPFSLAAKQTEVAGQGVTIELLDPCSAYPITPLARFTGERSKIWRWAITPDGRAAILAGLMPGHTLEVREIATGRTLGSQALGTTGEDNVLAIVGAGSQTGGTPAVVAIGGESGILRLFSLPSLSPAGEIRPGGKIDGVAATPDGTRFAVAYWPDGLAVFDVATRRRIVQCETTDVMPIYVNFSDDGSRLVSVNYKGGNLNLWDAFTGRLIRRQPILDGPMSLVKIPGAVGTGLRARVEGDRVAVGSAAGSVQLFSLNVGEAGLWLPTLVRREDDSTIHMLAASPDGKAIVGYLGSGESIVWRIDEPTP